jgi:hypothetical protein
MIIALEARALSKVKIFLSFKPTTDNPGQGGIHHD